MVQEKVEQLKSNIDFKLVTSLVVASVVIGALAFGAKKAGLNTVATAVKGG